MNNKRKAIMTFVSSVVAVTYQRKITKAENH